MKRKMAVAMATIMAVSPFTVFGASYNYRSRTVESVPEKTMLLEQSVYNKGLVDLGDTQKTDDVKYLASGTDLVIELRDKVATGDTFQVTLTNGEWDFQNLAGATNQFDSSKLPTNVNANGVIENEWLNTLRTVTANVGSSSYSAKQGAFGSSFVGSDINTNYQSGNGVYDGSRKYYRFPAGTGLGTNVNESDGELAYELNVSAGDKSVAIVTIKQTPQSDYNKKIIKIPVVAVTKGNGELKATIDARNTSISSGTIAIASLGSSSISATIKDQVFSKYSFVLENLKVTEKYTGTFKGGEVMILEAPYGYYWADPSKKVNKDGEQENVKVFFEGMKYNGSDSVENTNGEVSWYKGDKKKLVLNLDKDKFTQSSSFPGSIYFNLVTLVAEDYASYDQDIKVNVKEGKDNDFDEVSANVGQRKDWGISLVTKDDYSKFTLVNGRYDKDDDLDKNHKTATIKVEENVTNSWWAGRETTFTLDEGVKFIKVNIDNAENFNTDIEGDYVPHKGRDAYSSMDANKFTLFNLEVDKDKKAKFEMTSWLSIEPGVEGDISVYVNAVTDSDRKVVPSIKVAKSVSPATIKTEVRDVKTGLQFQKVADFTITETAPRMFGRDKQVVIEIDDEISGSDNIYIAPDFVVETNGTESKVDISKPVVKNGKITFNIERESDQKAAVIKFSNVYVKVDRTVPETNKRPYKIVLGGEAVVGNYYENNDQKSVNNYDPTFDIKGFGADYIKVVTPADNNESTLTTSVKVTVGSNKVLVGKDQEMEMDTAAYISTSGSTMVPVRFVSQALGIPENQVKWDNENRTVTIMATNKTIQFKIGSSDITVNGATYTMYSTDNSPIKVNAEIKDERAFLPFRQLGDALGVKVHWDETTKSAIYNYSEVEIQPLVANQNDVVQD